LYGGPCNYCAHFLDIIKYGGNTWIEFDVETADMSGVNEGNECV